MEKNILELIKKELKGIKEEAKKEELEVEDIIFDEYDEAMINEPTKKSFKTKTLKKGLAAAMLGLTLTTGFSGVPNTNNNIATVEAAKKKDKKKPVIKFAGESKINAEVNKSVKIPKTTAKDNKDGNVTKKITVKVTKGKKQYKALAKKIKSNKAVTFTSTGNYVITYTVKDKAGNKATKKRYVTVKEAQKEQTVKRPAPVNVVPAPATTEAPTTTEIPTTEAPTTEAPTTENNEEKIFPSQDLSKYGDIEKVVVNGITYNVAKRMNEETPIISSDEYSKSKFTSDSFDVDDIFSIGMAVGKNSKYNQDNMFYLSFLGNFKVEIDNVDLSNNIIFHPLSEEKPETVEILTINSSNKLISVMDIQIRYNDFETLKTLFPYSFPESNYEGYMLDEENEFIITPTPKEKTKENTSSVLKLTNEK